MIFVGENTLKTLEPPLTLILFLYLWHLCRRVYSFRLSVRMFVSSFVRSFVRSFVISLVQ